MNELDTKSPIIITSEPVDFGEIAMLNRAIDRMSKRIEQYEAIADDARKDALFWRNTAEKLLKQVKDLEAEKGSYRDAWIAVSEELQRALDGRIF